MILNKLHRALCALALATIPLITPTLAHAADFTTTEGYNATCQSMPDTPNSLTNDDDRVAFVICHDTTLVRQIITWATRGFRRMEAEQPTEEAIIGEVYGEIDHVRTQLAISRGVLEKIHLGHKKSLRLVPAQWQMDLNGDGKIDLWEQYLFAIPKRTDQQFAVHMPSDKKEYYDTHYQLDAAIQVDQSDVLWALSYHDFIEGALTNLRAFGLVKNHEVVLKTPQLLTLAHQLIDQGLNNSDKLRRSVLAETSNKEEWIGNPSQTDSVFPIALEAKDFATWAVIVHEWSAVWQGRHLMPTSRPTDLLGSIAPCEEGTGLNLAQLYLHPPQDWTISLQQQVPLSSPHCQKIDARHPLSTVQTMIENARQSDPGMKFLRYLYWTN